MRVRISRALFGGAGANGAGDFVAVALAGEGEVVIKLEASQVSEKMLK